MNAVVEVETAEVSTNALDVAVFGTVAILIAKVVPVVATSTQRFISMGGTSQNAVSPDLNFERNLAKAGA